MSERALASAAPLALAALLAFAPLAHARGLPPLDRRVVDEAGTLDAAARARLDGKLAAYEQRTGHQLAVVILGSLEGDVLEQLSLRAAEQWRLGDARRDDGLLIVLAMKERSARIEVGYGLEGAVPDALASRVIREQMAPRFAQGDVAGGLDAGLDVLMRAAAGESVGAPGADSTIREAPRWAHLMPLFVFIAFLVLSAIGGRGGRRGGGGGWGLLLLLNLLGGGRGGGGFGGGGGGGFSGGGGGFGGGGASGRW